jgi:hypothetical protein
MGVSWDLLIRRGLIIDGSGSPGVIGDVAVAGGRIAALGTALSGDARKSVDADGLAVTPGFIDIKTHSDFVLPINPKAESKVRQGVTTEIVGHCGFSVAPVLPGKARLLADYLSGGAPWLPFREVSFPEYLDTFPAVAVNTGMLVGHNTLRLMVMGLEDRAPSDVELNQMIALLEEGLRAGALGMSSGLFTPPGSFAKPNEIRTLCAVLRKYNAAYFTHIRDESNNVVDAVEEAIDIARTTGVHGEIVHLKCSGVDNWGKAKQILDRIAAARAGRQHVRDGIATLRTEKSQGEIVVSIPILPILQQTLDAGPTGELAFICGSSGKPLTKESFGNVFKDACRSAGLFNRSAHGCRKIAATRAAEAGATVAELNAIFGWKGTSMASLYTEAADRKRLALDAMAKVQGKANETATSMPSPSRQVRAPAPKTE